MSEFVPYLPEYPAFLEFSFWNQTHCVTCDYP